MNLKTENMKRIENGTLVNVLPSTDESHFRGRIIGFDGFDYQVKSTGKGGKCAPVEGAVKDVNPELIES